MPSDAGRPSLREIMSRTHLPALDGLRAVAVMIVIVSHYGFPLPADLGVAFFFVLSGFLITWLLLREHDQTGGVSLRQFYLRRVLRIFPAYYVFLMVVFAARLVAHSTPNPPMMLAGALYLTNYFNAWQGGNEGPLAHAWSLAVEEQFYLLWPLVFRWAIGLGRAKARRVVAVVIVVVVLWRSYLYLGLGVGSAYVYNAFDTRVDTLAIGCLLALTIDVPAVSRFLERLGRQTLLPLVTLAILLVSRLGGSFNYHYSVGMTVDALLIAVLISQLLQQQSRFWGWLENPVTRYIGRISYPMYLYHGFALYAASMAPGGTAVRLTVGVLGSVVAGSLSYRYVELPFLRLKRRFEVAL